MQRMVQLSEVHPPTVRLTECPPCAQNPDVKSQGTRDKAVRLRLTWISRACHYDTLRRAHHSFLTRYIGRQDNNSTDHPISYLDTLKNMGNESVDAIMRERRMILLAGFMARMEDTRLPNGVMFGRVMGGAGCGGGGEKNGWGVSWMTSELSVLKPASGRLWPRTRGMAQDGGTRGGGFHGGMDRCRESQGWTTTRNCICPNVTGRTKEKITQ